jgi:hypothetical protein
MNRRWRPAAGASISGEDSGRRSISPRTSHRPQDRRNGGRVIGLLGSVGVGPGRSNGSWPRSTNSNLSPSPSESLRGRAEPRWIEECRALSAMTSAASWGAAREVDVSVSAFAAVTGSMTAGAFKARFLPVLFACHLSADGAYRYPPGRSHWPDLAERSTASVT